MKAWAPCESWWAPTISGPSMLWCYGQRAHLTCVTAVHHWWCYAITLMVLHYSLMVLAHFWNRSICNQMCFQCGQSSLNYSITAWSEFYVWIWNSGRRFQCMYKVRQPARAPSENLYLSLNKTDPPVQIPPEEIRQKGRHCSRGREVGGRADKWGEQPPLKFSVPHRPNPHYSRQGERYTEVCTQWLGLRCHFTLFPHPSPLPFPLAGHRSSLNLLCMEGSTNCPPAHFLYIELGMSFNWFYFHNVDSTCNELESM